MGTGKLIENGDKLTEKLIENREKLIEKGEKLIEKLIENREKGQTGTGTFCPVSICPEARRLFFS